jgi:Tol biopolymer transport system component
MTSSVEGASVGEVGRGTANAADGPADGRFDWLAAGFGVWIVGGVFLVVWALNSGLTSDVGVSLYHAVGYLGILALAGFSTWLVARAVRSGRSWRAAFPAGFGSLGAGLAVLLAYVVADVAWREGVGIGEGIEGGFAPSRILLLAGLVLVAMAPLRAALRRRATPPEARPSRIGLMPAVVSAGLLAALVGVPGAYHSAVNPWLEIAPDVVEDNGEIWRMDADGRRQTRLIEGEERVEMSLPAWSPDGLQLACARWNGFVGGEIGDVDIWVANADGTDPRPLVEGDGWQWLPRWSPDGTSIAYTDEAQGGPWMTTGPRGRDAGALGPGFATSAAGPRPEADLWVVAVGGGSPIAITQAPGDDRSGSWSPDGARLAFDATRDGNTEVYLVEVDGSNPVRLTDEPGEDWAPAWSPDGRRIAFASDRTGIAQIFVMSPDGGNVTQLTDHEAGNNAPSWSPDGSRIAFQSWRTGEAEIWSMAADGSDPVNLTRSPATADAMWDGAWGPDGIAFSRSTYPPAFVQPVAREDLGVAALLIESIATALVAVVLASIRPPFGSFTVVLAIATLLAASQADGWRFVPAAVAGGLVVDILVRLAPERRKATTAGAATAIVVVLAPAVTVIATSELGWTPTLLLGAALAAGLAGWGMGGLVRPQRPAEAESAS